jgi:hypothetical protein
MQSIGKDKIAKLKQIVHTEVAVGFSNTPELYARILSRIPSDWFYIWELAADEIEKTLSDEAIEMTESGEMKEDSI